MKQSVDLMKSHSEKNSTTATRRSAFARQIVLTLAFFIAGSNAAWCQDIVTLWEGSTTDKITLSGYTLWNGLRSVEDRSSAFLNVYTSDDGLSVFKGDWGNDTGLSSTSLSKGEYYASFRRKALTRMAIPTISWAIPLWRPSIWVCSSIMRIGAKNIIHCSTPFITPMRTACCRRQTLAPRRRSSVRCRRSS